jgi:hypothetical protein
MVLAPSADLERSSFDPTRTTPSSTSPTKSAGSSGKTQRSSHIFFADTVKEESFDEAQIAVSYLEAAGRSRRKSIIPSFKSPRRASIIPSSLTAADSSSTTGGGYKSGFTSIISSLFRRGTVANIKANQQEESDQSFEKVEAEEINNEPSFNRPYTIYDNG